MSRLPVARSMAVNPREPVSSGMSLVIRHAG